MKKNRKIIITFILILLVGLNSNIQVMAKSSKSGTGIVLKNSTEVKSSTSKSSKRIYTFNQGEQVIVTGVKGNYYILKGKNNAVGYVKKNSVALTYILVDISEQKMYIYNNGSKKGSTSVVTGKKGVSDTPKGHYTLKRSNFKRNATLMNNTHVDYWMPFDTSRGIGFHDASWRSSFGGSRYIKKGSHGCVNMKTSDAKKLFESAPSKVDVIVRQ